MRTSMSRGSGSSSRPSSPCRARARAALRSASRVERLAPRARPASRGAPPAPRRAAVAGLAVVGRRQLDGQRAGRGRGPSSRAPRVERQRAGERQRREIDHERDEPGQEAPRAVAVERDVETARGVVMAPPACRAGGCRVSSPFSRWSRGWPKRATSASLCVAMHQRRAEPVHLLEEAQQAQSAISSSTLPVGSSASSRLGPADHRAGDRDALLLAARQRRRPRARAGRRARPSRSSSLTCSRICSSRDARRRAAAAPRCRRPRDGRSGGNPGTRRRSCAAAPAARAAASSRCRGRTARSGRATGARRDR